MERSTKVLLVTAASVFLAFLDATIVNVAFPALRADFPATSLAGASWVLSAYGVTFAALLVPAGLAGDLLGRRRLFLGGLAVFLGASVLCALAPSIPLLAGARIVQAAGGAALVPSSLGLLLPEVAPEKRPSATALWGASGAVAAATGPTLGGLLVEQAGWRWVFLVNVPIGLGAIAFGSRVLVERRAEGPARRPDLIGAGLLVATIAGLTLGITQGPATQWGWADARTLTALGVAVLAGAGFVARSAGRADALMPLELFRIRRFAAANAGSFAFALAFYALLLANVTFLTSVWGYGILRTGLAISPSPLAAAGAAPVAGRLCERFGTRAVAVPAVLLFAVGCAGFAARTQTSPDYVARWLPAAVLGGLGIGGTFAAFGAAAVADLPPQRFATGGAITQTSRQVGAALGVAAFVAVLGSPEGGAVLGAFHRCWWAMAASAVLASGFAVLLGRPVLAARLVPAT